jgi:hypothetical protein
MTVSSPPPSLPDAGPDAGKPSSQAITALVLSILGFVTCCGLVLSPVGWYLGSQELKAIAAGRSPAAGETISRVAQVMGLVGTIFLGLALLWLFAMGGMMVVSAWMNQVMH